MPYEKKQTSVHGTAMAYVEVGAGDPIVLLHGNPTSSYLWRHVIPLLSGRYRCLAPDLIGMGDSEKLTDSGPDRYRFADHRRWVDAWVEAVGAGSDVTLVVHDWGSAIGFDWARRHPHAVRGIAYTEAIVAPVVGDELSPEVAGLFSALRSPAGEELVLEHNGFIEQILASSLRYPSDDVMEEYRRPFATAGESRRPMLTLAREVPIDGVPADVHEAVTEYRSWLATSSVSKLFVNADPGASVTGAAREQCRRWPNQREVTVRSGHFVPEDAAAELGAALREWLAELDAGIAREVA